MNCLCLLLVAALAASVQSRTLTLNNTLVCNDAGLPMFAISALNTSWPAAVGSPSHGCWLDSNSSVKDRVVWLTSLQPSEHWRWCTFQWRALVQLRAGARAVVIALVDETWAGSTNNSIVMFGWGATEFQSADVAVVSNATYQRALPLMGTPCLIGAPTPNDSAAALYYWNSLLGYIVAFTVLFGLCALTGVLVLRRRLRTLLRVERLRVLLNKDVTFSVLILLIATSLWKALCSTLAAFLQLWPLIGSSPLGWPAYVWLSDVGDILLYDMLALFVFSWGRLLFKLEGPRGGDRHAIIVRYGTWLFIILYTLLSVASLLTATLAPVPAGPIFRCVLLVAAILYLCASFSFVGVRLVRYLILQVGSARNDVSRRVIVIITVYCALLVVALVLNGALLIVNLALDIRGNMTTAVLESVADVMLLVNTALFFLHTVQQHSASKSSGSGGSTNSDARGSSVGPVSPRRHTPSPPHRGGAGAPSQAARQARIVEKKAVRDAENALQPLTSDEDVVVSDSNDSFGALPD